MYAELIPAIIALSGVLVGGVVNFFATKQVKRQEWKLELAKNTISDRRKVYADFFVTSQKYILHSIDDKYSTASQFLEISTCLANVEITASDEVSSVAKRIYDYCLQSHEQDKKSAEHNFSTLRAEYILAVREELKKNRR